MSKEAKRIIKLIKKGKLPKLSVYKKKKSNKDQFGLASLKQEIQNYVQF